MMGKAIFEVMIGWCLPEGKVKEGWELARQRDVERLVWEHGRGSLGLRTSDGGRVRWEWE